MRKVIISVLLALGILLAFTASAQAIIWTTAFNLSFNQNWHNCYNRLGDGFYTCNIPDYETPTCNPTGQNKRGVAQWVCNSAYVQNPVYPGIPIVGSPRICKEVDPWDPYGTHVTGGSINCSNIGGVG